MMDVLKMAGTDPPGGQANEMSTRVTMFRPSLLQNMHHRNVVPP